MERTCEESETGSPMASVSEISGEPAIVINGVPQVVQSANSIPTRYATSNAEPKRHPGFGDWLVGRTVQKLFGECLYSGSVTIFDKETGWYRVVYEDGDFEDLEWHELEPILVPMDIAVPIKDLALKMLEKNAVAASVGKQATSRIRPCMKTKRKARRGSTSLGS